MRTFYARGVPRYTNGGIPRPLPFDFVACASLRAAREQGCDEIVVESPSPYGAKHGLLSRRYRVADVEAMCRKYPALRKFLPRAQTPIERLLARYERVGSLFVNQFGA